MKNYKLEDYKMEDYFLVFFLSMFISVIRDTFIIVFYNYDFKYSPMFSFFRDIFSSKNENSTANEEYQYLDLIKNILKNGYWENGRNGKTISIFGNSMRFSLRNNKIPILTTKKVAWKTCLKELLWFIRGDTDNKILKEQNVHIWDANGSRDFLDSRGLTKYEEDELGPIYGYQWRCFNKPYLCRKEIKLNREHWDGLDKDEKLFIQHDINETGGGIDQLQEIINILKDPKQRTSRRLIMTAWNPCQLDQMALPPCHVLCQFNVHDGNKLSCSLYQRSCDCALGVPFNIASYSFLTHLIAAHCGLEAEEFVYFMGNCHIYEEHVDGMKEQIERVPLEFPTLKIKEIRDKIDDYKVEDFIIENYKSHETIKMNMVA